MSGEGEHGRRGGGGERERTTSSFVDLGTAADSCAMKFGLAAIAPLASAHMMGTLMEQRGGLVRRSLSNSRSVLNSAGCHLLG